MALNNNSQKPTSLHLIFYLPYLIDLLITGQLSIPPFISLEILLIFWKIVLEIYFAKVLFLKKCISIYPALWHWFWKRTDVNERKCFLITVTIILLWYLSLMNLNQLENKTTVKSSLVLLPTLILLYALAMCWLNHFAFI